MDKIERLREKGYKYLVHTTFQKNVENVVKSTKTFNTMYERYLHRVQADGVYAKTTIDFTEKFELNPHEYPGLFLHLSHKNIEDFIYPEEHSASYVVFPLELLLQQNWHFKLIDKNGLIEYDTYFPHNMDKIPSFDTVKEYYDKKMGYYIGNEVVFHDGLPLSNAICVVNPPKSLEEEIKESCKWDGDLNKLDMTKRPNYVFYSDRRYDGVKVPYYHHLFQDSITTDDFFYIEFIQRHLSEEYKSLCEGVETKEELERRMYATKVDGMDLFTYLHIHRP